MSHVEMRQLEYFIAVAEELHFGRAARRLRMSQPPLSTQIKRLEHQLGVELFERTSRSVRLTGAGELLLSHARRAVAACESFEDVAGHVRAGTAGRLRIGYVGSAAFGTLPAIIRVIRRAAPGMRLELRAGNSAEHATALSERRLDLALLRPKWRLPDLEYIAAYHETLVAIVPEESRFGASAEPMHLAELADAPFIMFEYAASPGLVDEMLKACQESGFTPRSEHLVTRMQDLVGLVAAGLGVSIVPDTIQMLSMKGAVYRPLLDETATSVMMLAYRRADEGLLPQPVLDAIDMVRRAAPVEPAVATDATRPRGADDIGHRFDRYRSDIDPP